MLWYFVLLYIQDFIKIYFVIPCFQWFILQFLRGQRQNRAPHHEQQCCTEQH